MSIERDGDALILRGVLTVSDAALWWPHTHGAQPLHDVTIQVHSDVGPISLELGRVGFRSIDLDTRGRAARYACFTCIDIRQQ